MTARRNISLRDELKARMDATTEPVNWSGVAAKAFDDQLPVASLEKSMAQIVDRLRVSRHAYAMKEPEVEVEVDRYGEGLLAGIRWASDSAEWPRLVQLEHIAGALQPDDWDSLPGLVEGVQRAVAGEAPGAFWSALGLEEQPPARCGQGFCDGALTILGEVQKLF